MLKEHQWPQAHSQLKVTGGSIVTLPRSPYGAGARLIVAEKFENIKWLYTQTSIPCKTKWGSPSRFINQPRSLRQRLWPHHEGAACKTSQLRLCYSGSCKAVNSTVIFRAKNCEQYLTSNTKKGRIWGLKQPEMNQYHSIFLNITLLTLGSGPWTCDDSSSPADARGTSSPLPSSSTASCDRGPIWL